MTCPRSQKWWQLNPEQELRSPDYLCPAQLICYIMLLSKENIQVISFPLIPLKHIVELWSLASPQRFFPCNILEIQPTMHHLTIIQSHYTWCRPHHWCCPSAVWSRDGKAFVIFYCSTELNGLFMWWRMFGFWESRGLPRGEEAANKWVWNWGVKNMAKGFLSHKTQMWMDLGKIGKCGWDGWRVRLSWMRGRETGLAGVKLLRFLGIIWEVCFCFTPWGFYCKRCWAFFG